MREIKFRAWIKSQKKMETCVEVNPFYVGDCDRSHWKYDEVILEQFTGLKDKNGKEIYEGDIVEIKQYSILEVEVYCRKQKPYEVGERLVITSLFPIMDIRGIDDYQAYVLNNIPFSYNGHMNRPRADSYQFWNFHRYVEVIGNIHDNPELLESEEEK